MNPLFDRIASCLELAVRCGFRDPERWREWIRDHKIYSDDIRRRADKLYRKVANEKSGVKATGTFMGDATEYLFCEAFEMLLRDQPPDAFLRSSASYAMGMLTRCLSVPNMCASAREQIEGLTEALIPA